MRPSQIRPGEAQRLLLGGHVRERQLEKPTTNRPIRVDSVPLGDAEPRLGRLKYYANHRVLERAGQDSDAEGLQAVGRLPASLANV